MKTLTAAEIQLLMKKATTLEQFHELGLILCLTLKEKYKAVKYTCYVQKGSA